MKHSTATICTLALASFVQAMPVQAQQAAQQNVDVSEASLLQTLPGLSGSYATVNGIRLHYVAGGEGAPVSLLAGWPETWWA